MLAKLAVTADHVSGGRVEVGIGAGWWEREHELYGFELPPIGPRMEALEEQMQIVRGHWGEGPFSFDGEHYSAHELDARPKPVQRPLPLILGAKGGPRSLRIGRPLGRRVQHGDGDRGGDRRPAPPPRRGLREGGTRPGDACRSR